MFLLLKTLYKNKMNSLRETIFCDIQSEIYKYYDKEDIEYNCKEEPEESIINFFSYLYRLIPVIKRKVHYEYSDAAEPLFRKSGNRLSGIGNRHVA